MPHKLTQERLKELFSYDELTGLFTRKVNSGNFKAGDVASYTESQGYVVIKMDGKTHKAHRLVWLYLYGAFPSSPLDHINRIKTDNKRSNLREVTFSENLHNRSATANSKSGAKGVVKTASGRFVASIQVNGIRHSVGTFDTIEQASIARAIKAEELLRPGLDIDQIKVTDEMKKSQDYVSKRHPHTPEALQRMRDAQAAVPKYGCAVCGVIRKAGGMALHHKATGHAGRIPENQMDAPEGKTK